MQDTECAFTSAYYCLNIARVQHSIIFHSTHWRCSALCLTSGLSPGCSHCSGRSTLSGRAWAPLFWVKMEEMTDGREASRASKSTPPPLSQGLDQPLHWTVSLGRTICQCLYPLRCIYKWVPAHSMLRIIMWWTSIPSRGSKNTSSHLMIWKPG